jgi:hypothetical protein
VRNNPLRWIDPMGLVAWSGTIKGAVFTEVFGAGTFKINLESECVNGKKAKVTVWAIGSGIGVGGFADLSSGTLTVNDYHTDLQPYDLNGYFQLASVGYATGPGYGAYSIAIGTDGSSLGGKGARGYGHGAYTGWGAGAFVIGGSSTVTSAEITDFGCGCGK